MSPEMQALVALRKAGAVPVTVTILLDDYRAPRRGLRWHEVSIGGEMPHPRIYVEPGESIGRLDLRALVGLDVWLQAKRYSQRLWDLATRITEVPANTLVTIAGDEGGWTWVRGRDHSDLGDWQGTSAWLSAQRRAA
ncbi:MAG: hypothetical protein ABFD89_23650 [Bryobacteraceae bacterium]